MGKRNVLHNPNQYNDKWDTMTMNSKGYTWGIWNDMRRSKGYIAVDPPEYSGIEVTHKPRWGGSTDSISYERFLAGEGRSPITNIERPPSSSDSNVAPSREGGKRKEPDHLSPEAVPDPKAARGNSQQAGPSGGPTGTVIREDQPIEVDSAPAPVPAAASGEMAGHMSQSDGGFDSTQGPVKILKMPGYPKRDGYKSFQAVHRMKSFALPFTKLDAGGSSGNLYTTTPLMYVPWDQMMFYMSEDKFNLLPRPCEVHRVKLYVQHVTSSVQFETGSGASTIAQTGHAKIMCTADNLPQKVRGGVIRKYNWSNIDMKPDGILNYAPQDFYNEAWGARQSDPDWNTQLAASNLRIPYYTKDYFTILENNAARAATIGINEDNAPGSEYFMDHVEETNMNDNSWKDVKEREYYFESARVGKPYQVFELRNQDLNIPTGKNAQNLNTTRSMTRVPPKVPPSAGTIYTNTTTTCSENFAPQVLYTGFIEQGASSVIGLQGKMPKVQPTFWCGLRAIDTNTPNLGTTSTTFVNASAFWNITANIEFKLPTYPMDRFLRPQNFTLNIEDAEMGTGRYMDFNSLYTFGLPSETTTRPTKAVTSLRGRNRRANPLKPKPKRRLDDEVTDDVLLDG